VDPVIPPAGRPLACPFGRLPGIPTLSIQRSPSCRRVGTRIADTFSRERTAASQRTRTGGRIDLSGRRPGEPGCSPRQGPWQGPRRRYSPHPPDFARSPVRPSGISCLLAAAASTPPRRMVRSWLPAFPSRWNDDLAQMQSFCVPICQNAHTILCWISEGVGHCTPGTQPLLGSERRTGGTTAVRESELSGENPHILPEWIHRSGGFGSKDFAGLATARAR
jgi:hypothetical protein